MYLTVQNAQTEAFERVYVEGKQIDTDEYVTAGDASTNAGTYVRRKVHDKYPESGTFTTGLATITATSNGEIEISTTDFIVEGAIDAKGGNLTWGEIETNGPGIKIINVPATLDKNDSVTLSIKRIDVSGNAKWTSDKTNIATVNENTGEVTGVAAGTATITARVTESGKTYTAQCTITVVLPEQVIGQYVDLGTNILGKGTTKDWRILTKDSTGTWVILADYYPMTDEMATQTGLPREVSKGVKTKYNINASSQDALIAGLNSSEWARLNPSKGTVYGAVTAEKLIESYNQIHENHLTYSGGVDDTDTLYVPHNSIYGEADCYGYWLATRDGTDNVWFMRSLGLGSFKGSSTGGGLRPAVFLEPTVTLTKTGSGENAVWTAQ